MEKMLEPWLVQAAHLLKQRVPPQCLVFQGELVPVDLLLPLLKDRLCGILTQVVGAVGIGAEESSASDILHEFPWLRSLICNSVFEWVSAVGTFLQRLHRDRTWLAAALKLGALPPIEAISGTASDMHAGGHSVIRIRFQGGGCLYYKPRPLTGEWLWRELLEAIARLDPQLHLPAARVFTSAANRSYGWAESVFAEEQFHPSDTSSNRNFGSAADYWHAAGALLCLAQFARLTDLHLANLVATSRGPAVTDAECLATPVLHRPPHGKTSQNDTAIADAIEAIASTGLLSTPRDPELPDVSGFFGHAVPVSAVRLPAWTLSSDGRYQLTTVGAELVDHRNAPTQTTSLAVLPQLLGGYRHAAELLLRARKTLLATGSQWRAVLEQRHSPRMVIRDTLTYGWVMSRSLEPRFLRSFYRRRNDILSALKPHAGRDLPAALLRTELGALQQLHIPRLTILPGSRTLATGTGHAIACRFAALSPADAVLQSIESLSPESIDNIHVPALLSSIL
jgi:lantibiotic modifying enzyme